MPTFAYTAIDAAGQRKTGSLDVSSRTEVYRALERQALTPVKVSESAGSETPAPSSPRRRAEKSDRPSVTDQTKKPAAAAVPDRKSIATDDDGNPIAPPKLGRSQLINFTSELGDLLDAGLPLDMALRVMEERQEHPTVRQISAVVRHELRDGSRLSDALRTSSSSFDDLYCNLVAAGESSGTLTSTLRRLASNLTITQELQTKFISAMIYPAVMVGACTLLFVVFMTVLVPQMTDLLAQTGQDLPMITLMLVRFSDFMTSWWWLLLGIVIGLIFGFRHYINSDSGRAWWDAFKLRIPLFGPVISTRFFAGFAQSLSNLVKNGIPLLTGLKLMGKATTNTFIKDKIELACEEVGDGTPFSQAMRHVGGFPQLLSDMVAVGEQTGNLSASLEKAAVRYDRELDTRISRLTALITPTIIVIVAILVALVALAIISAVFSSLSALRG